MYSVVKANSDFSALYLILSTWLLNIYQHTTGNLYIFINHAGKYDHITKQQAPLHKSQNLYFVKIRIIFVLLAQILTGQSQTKIIMSSLVQNIGVS